MRTETLHPATLSAPTGSRRLIELIDRWFERASGRRQLAEMSEAQLKDIGITRCDAARELEKPFWQA